MTENTTTENVTAQDAAPEAGTPGEVKTYQTQLWVVFEIEEEIRKISIEVSLR